MKEFADWIKAARKRSGKSQEQLAQLIGVTKGNVSAWEHGLHKPKMEHVIEIERATGEPAPAEIHHIYPIKNMMQPMAEGVTVDLLPATVSMGPGEHRAEHESPAARLVLSDPFIARLRPTKPEALRLLHAYGDSMEPTFSSGDILLVDTGVREIKIDGIYVLTAHNRLFVKRVRQRMDGSFEVSSDNPTHKTTDILSGKHQVQVLGRVLYAWHGHRL